MYRLNEYKDILVKQIIKRLNPLYILTLNTCSSMSISSLNSHLSLLSAIVNKDKLKLGNKWYRKKTDRVYLFSFNEISKGGHSHSNVFLDCPPQYQIEDVIEKILMSLEEGGFIKTTEDENGDTELIKVV